MSGRADGQSLPSSPLSGAGSFSTVLEEEYVEVEEEEEEEE